jgi:hypothetical protein
VLFVAVILAHICIGGLPWPCRGTPEQKHPGTAILYNTSLHAKDGGGTFRARFGVERNGTSLLAEGSYSAGSEIKDGYPIPLAGLPADYQKLGIDTVAVALCEDGQRIGTEGVATQARPRAVKAYCTKG